LRGGFGGAVVADDVEAASTNLVEALSPSVRSVELAIKVDVAARGVLDA
jgi:hypothetical protein